MTERIQRLRRLFDQNDERAMFFERMLLLEEAKRQYAHCGRGELYARAFAHLLTHMTIDIRPDEMLVGAMHQTVPDETQERQYEKICEWNDFRLTNLFSGDAIRHTEFADGCKYMPEWFAAWGHFCPDMNRVLRLGYRGIADEARARLKNSTLSRGQIDFLYNVIIIAEAVCVLGKRYAALAEELAGLAQDAAERTRLLEIKRICERTPALPAQSFHEALQTIWLTHLLENACCGARDYSFGRIDQYLYPYYEADVKAGCLTKEDALELIEDLFIHVNEMTGRSWENHKPKRISCANSIQYFILGGADEAGNDLSNELSYICLHACEEMGYKEPALIVRWHPNIDTAFMDECVRICAAGIGYPSFFDERKIIHALISRGMPIEAAREFAYHGCNNICIPGQSDELHENWHSLPKYLELALNEGVCMKTGKRVGAVTPPVSQIDSYDALFAALTLQTQHAVMQGAKIIWDFDREWSARKPMSFESVLTTHGIERAQSASEGATDHKVFANHLVGIGTMANSLYAIDEICFRKKLMTLSELVEVLKANWQGQELLRQRIWNRFLKFGNDDNTVDAYAEMTANMFVQTVCALDRLPNGRVAYPTIYSLWRHQEYGRDCAASADGRFAGEPLSESLSGTFGTEKNGPTASLNSAARLPLSMTPSGGNNVKFQPVVVSGADGLSRLRSMIEAYFEQGGTQLQINILDPAVLLDARKNPENHKNLLVRVVGYSAYFVTLSPQEQDEIIARSAHI